MKKGPIGGTFSFFAVVFFMLSAGPLATHAQAVCNGSQLFTAKSCAGDTNSAVEKELFQLVNKYRTANGRPELKLSVPLGLLANRRIIDLQLNMKSLTHSWSNCSYDLKDEKTWPCVLDAPKRLNSGYNGQGYETLYRTTTGQAAPGPALQAWEKSALHNSIILNSGMFKDLAWDEVGAAVDGAYAVLWFGCPGKGKPGMGQTETGLGVSYDTTVAGLTKLFAIKQTSGEVESGKWQGFSADKKIKLELYGTRPDISEANMAISMKLDAGRLSPLAQTAVSTLLKNLFPEWPDIDTWLSNVVSAIGKDPTVTKTKLVRKIAINITADGPGSLKVLIQPESKKRYVEVF